jgi:hypothetical protein
MYGKRLALGASVVALVVAVSGVLNNSAGQSVQPQAPGLTYGGTKHLDILWLRLHPSRARLAAAEIPWEIAAERCTNDTNGYFSILYVGLYYDEPVAVSAQGTFRKTVVDRYRDRGIRYEEHQTLTGTITDERVTGTIRARTVATKPNGRVARCNSLPQRWSAVN